MEAVRVERLDHFGLLASVRKDVGRISRLDARRVPEKQEERTPGAAVAGMLRKGLGLAHRPLSLMPPFFANTPRARLLRAGGEAPMCTRFKRGRTLDEVDGSGCDRLGSALALAVGAQDGLKQRLPQLAPPRFALRGDDVPQRAEPAMRSTHGSAPAHRPDGQQAVLALLVSPDGGGALGRQSGAGHASETPMVQERAQALRQAVAPAPTPRDRVADAQRAPEDTAAPLAQRGCITRIPGPLQLVAQVRTPVRTPALWPRLEATPRSHRREWGPDGMAQRGLVISSQAARERAEASVTTAQQRAGDAREPPLLPWPAQRLEPPQAAHAALAALAPSWRAHQGETAGVIDHTPAGGTGRPPPPSPSQAMAWQRQAPARPEPERRACRQPQGACLVSGTPIDRRPLSDLEVLQAYKAPAPAAGGCRFLTAP
jgi:hypothetical protein